MSMFRVTMIVSDGDLASLVKVLNARSRDGYIERETRVDGGWLVCLAVGERSDAEHLRTLSLNSKGWPSLDA
ncbi:hypothetical protein [Methylobacterium currus]|uniref:hypothetical protein n=1 Tax=Methylobacterium currus TaxID=2051553 RepID=UPI000F4F5BDC|nr:hypothetical protein [Methylobacterium currus]